MYCDNILSESFRVDWAEAFGDNCEGWEVIDPLPSESDLDEYWEDWRDYCDDIEDARERFLSGDGCNNRVDEWRDSLMPMMGFAWPIDLRSDPEEAATAIAGVTGNVTLIRFGDRMQDAGFPEYVLALTGGGMDLSWDICGAYVACGHVPPASLLESLPRMAGSRYGATIGDHDACRVLNAAEIAAAFMARRAERIAEHAKSIREAGE